MNTKSIHSFCRYQQAYQQSILNPKHFWQQQSEAAHWFKKPSLILDDSRPPFFRWFPDGQLNVTYNCLDRHLPNRANQVALYHVSPGTNTDTSLTYGQLHDKVARFAGALRDLGVNKGDRVVIYMPMVPEAVIAMLATTRIGAIHSVVFGGFAAPELGSRINDAQPKVIVTCNYGMENNKKILYGPMVEQVKGNVKEVVFQRSGEPKRRVEYDFDELVNKSKGVDAVAMESNDPAYILYTSGTTGAPKGIVRDQGGMTVSLMYAMKELMGVNSGDCVFAGSDIGWVVGHSFSVYGPLLSGCSSVIYEGKPVGTPDAGAYWRIVESKRVKMLFTAPTALRALRREDSDGEWIRKCDVSSLKTLAFAGERCDIPTYKWVNDHLPGVFSNDNYWQTETGWPVVSNFANLTQFKMKPGSATKPVPGFNVSILDDQGSEITDQRLGKLCLKYPTPPSFALTLWNNDQAFLNKYFTDNPGLYSTGDLAYRDQEGYIHMQYQYYYYQPRMTRTDDVINTAGHRLSTAQIEEVIMHHPHVAEACVIGILDELKGEIPIGFVTLKDNHALTNHQTLEQEIIKLIRQHIGPVASFKICLVVPKLPKTRSGKYLRHILRKMANNQPYTVPPTIEDQTVLEPLDALIKSHGLAKKQNIQFEEYDQS